MSANYDESIQHRQSFRQVHRAEGGDSKSKKYKARSKQIKVNHFTWFVPGAGLKYVVSFDRKNFKKRMRFDTLKEALAWRDEQIKIMPPPAYKSSSD